MKTHFGFTEVSFEEKKEKVQAVFSSVASKYDIMNDVMSLGVHRLWKAEAIRLLDLAPTHQVLDVAGGTGDLTHKIHTLLGSSGHVTLLDYNFNMLQEGRHKLINLGVFEKLSIVQADGQALPFASNQFDRISIAFGLRNIPKIPVALAEFYRVLKPGGKLLILEFSKIHPRLAPLYDPYSFKIIPWMGKLIAQDRASYQYLVESIRKHPDQETLVQHLKDAGFSDSRYHNLSFGIVAIHLGEKR